MTEGNETCTVALSNLVNTTGTAAITDASGTGTIINDDISLIGIHDIQGASHTSPLVGQTVTTRGIVTAVDTNGFYFQAPDAEIDANDATSEGLFVLTSSAPTVTVGQLVTVTGAVAEFIPGGAGTNNLSTTQLTGPVINVISSNNPLPTATILGAGGRMAPTEIIDDDNFTSFDPATDGIDFFESVEGMLVTVPQPLVFFLPILAPMPRASRSAARSCRAAAWAMASMSPTPARVRTTTPNASRSMATPSPPAAPTAFPSSTPAPCWATSPAWSPTTSAITRSSPHRPSPWRRRRSSPTM
ncbi:hypothetical protein GCM10007973_19840 [Polymorphobacter multimanifer]|nr:hypothetical protein GCM10007973_19840 [Polymorphobacter multimanifer]